VLEEVESVTKSLTGDGSRWVNMKMGEKTGPRGVMAARTLSPSTSSSMRRVAPVASVTVASAGKHFFDFEVDDESVEEDDESAEGVVSAPPPLEPFFLPLLPVLDTFADAGAATERATTTAIRARAAILARETGRPQLIVDLFGATL
jgi:hypothetical protein